MASLIFPSCVSADETHGLTFFYLNPCYVCACAHTFSPRVGLKHVSDENKTHKNPNLRSQATPVKTKSPGNVNSPRAVAQKRPPLLELEGKKWRVVRQMFTPPSEINPVFSTTASVADETISPLVVAGKL